MTDRDRTLQIVDAPRRPSHCRDCGKPIEWATLAGKGKAIPLNPNPLILGYMRNSGGVKFATISARNLHFATCRARRAREARP